jgi:hypothetical protein
MNHTASWQEAATRVVADLLVGRWARLGPTTQTFNEINFKMDQPKPLTLTRRRLAQARRNLLALLATVPEARLSNEFGRQQVGWWAKWCTYGHYNQHLADLNQFRKQLNSK